MDTPKHSPKAPNSSQSRVDPNPANREKTPSKPHWKSVVGSILAAAIGVQSNKNRENDFSQTSIWPFVIGGIVFTLIFIASLVFVATTAINH